MLACLLRSGLVARAISAPVPVTTQLFLDSLAAFKSQSSFALATSYSRNMTVDIPKEGKVPEDFVIASSARLQHISQIAKSAGLEKDEVLPYGHHKAKVSVFSSSIDIPNLAKFSQ